MRKIFNTLEETTPNPCSAEYNAYEKAFEVWFFNFSKLVTLKSAILIAEANLLKITKMRAEVENKIFIHKIIMQNTKNDILVNEQQLEENSIFYSPFYYNYLVFEYKILYRKSVAEFKLLKKYNNKIEWCNQVEGYTIETKKEKEKEQAIYNAAAPSLLNAWDTAAKELNACRNPSLCLRINLKPSCKEIKQNIKTVNQKLISLDNKLINLNHGISSLNVLKINKNLSNEKIKISKELIVKLDKLNPIIFSSEKLKSKKLNEITSDSSFYDIYKKAKDDLASYQTEGKTLEAKIKNLKEKNIPEKKKRLKNKISNLFKEFKICSKNIPA